MGESPCTTATAISAQCAGQGAHSDGARSPDAPFSLGWDPQGLKVALRERATSFNAPLKTVSAPT